MTLYWSGQVAMAQGRWHLATDYLTDLRLRNAAVAFDRQLQAGLNEEEVAIFTRVLNRLAANVAGPRRAVVEPRRRGAVR